MTSTFSDFCANKDDQLIDFWKDSLFIKDQLNEAADKWYRLYELLNTEHYVDRMWKNIYVLKIYFENLYKILLFSDLNVKIVRTDIEIIRTQLIG